MKDNGLLYAILVLSVISMLISGYAVNKSVTVEVPEIEIPEVKATVDVEAVANAVADKLVMDNTATVSVNYSDDVKSDIAAIKGEIFKDDSIEAKAEELALAELGSRDFKKALVEFLNEKLGNTTSIESYRDIVSVSVKDTDVEVEDTEATVVFEVKVAYFLDGDDDDSDKESAKLDVELVVEDLDDEEEFIDAEVDGDYGFTLVKFYD